MKKRMSPVKRVWIITLIAGILSGLLVTLLFVFVFDIAWWFLITPAVVGWAIRKFARITPEEVEADPRLQTKVGWMCAAITGFWVLLLVFFVSLILYAVTGFGILAPLLMNPLFLGIAAVSVWYGYMRGNQAVLDGYYDSKTEDEE